MSRFVLVRSLLLLLLTTFSWLPCRVSAQQQLADDDARWQGTHVFRRSLFEMKFTPLRQKFEIHVAPRRTIVVLLGKTGFDQNLGLTRFVRNGGAVLVASDRVPQDDRIKSALSQLAGVQIARSEAICRNPNSCYLNQPFCPLLVPSRRDPMKLFHDPDKGNLSVATNLPSWLVVEDGAPKSISHIAWLPRGTITQEWDRFGREESRAWQIFGPLFGVAGKVGRGKVMVLADHSIFINAMTLSNDNNNVEFAARCMQWLRESDGAPTRDHVLFLENGNVNGLFEVPLEQKPFGEFTIDDWRKLLANFGPIASKLEDKNAFNEWLWAYLYRRRFSPRKIARIAMILGTLVALVYLFYRVTRNGRYNSEPALPSLRKTLRSHQPADMQVPLRLDTMLEGNNLWEAGRELARGVFARAGIPAPVVEAKPRVLVEGGFFTRFKKRRWVLRLWNLAFGERAVAIPHKDWKGLLSELKSLEAELASGTLRIESPAAVSAKSLPRVTTA